MDSAYVCPDCAGEHDQPGEAVLGHQVRCLDCMIEIELALELQIVTIGRAA